MNTSTRPFSGDPIMRRPLWAGELCDVSESRWVRDAHGPKRREHTPFPTLVFMRRGSYTRRLGGRTYVGDPLQTVYYHAGDDGKVDHPYGDWTVGTGIRLLPGGSLASVLEAISLGSTHIERGSFPERLAERSVRTERLHRAVVRELRLPERDDVRVEERLVALLCEAMSDMMGEERVRGGIPAAGFPGRHERMVSTAQAYLSWAYSRPLTLSLIAREVGCSPWHLSRLFRAVLGIPVHQYLTRVRLRHAVEQLEMGEQSLSRIALACGFSSHSHFTSAFGREFGEPPAQWRLVN